MSRDRKVVPHSALFDSKDARGFANHSLCRCLPHHPANLQPPSSRTEGLYCHVTRTSLAVGIFALVYDYLGGRRSGGNIMVCYE